MEKRADEWLIDVAHHHNQIVAGLQCQRFRNPVLQVDLVCADCEIPLLRVGTQAIESGCRDVDGINLKAGLGEKERVSARATSDVKRRAPTERIDELRKQCRRMTSFRIAAATIARIPFVKVSLAQ